MNFNNLTLIIPAKFESESLPKFLDELSDINPKILVIMQKDDYKTIESIKDYRNLKILFQNINGYGAALIEGFNSCETEYCCIINNKKKLQYICLPSFERSRIGGKKKVNALKDGFLILITILRFLFKTKK